MTTKVAALVFLLSGLAGAQAVLETLPYSGAVLVHRAIKADRIHIKPTLLRALSVLPDVDIDPTPNPVNETPVVVNPKNPKQLLAGSNDYNCSTGRLSFHTSDDGGSTWLDHCFDLYEGQGTQGDPGVAYDLNGTAYISGIASVNGIIFQKSSDNGKTWSAPSAAVTCASCFLTDKPWLQADTNPSSPFRNSLYISVTQYASASSNNNQITLTYSHNGGKTWTTGYRGPVQTVDVDEFTDIAIAADGTLYLTWQRCTPTVNSELGTFDCGGTRASYYLVKSSDGGKTWTKPRLMFKSNLVLDGCACAFYGNLPGSSVRVSNIPVIAVDAQNRLYVVYYNWTGIGLAQGQMQMKIATSLDGGTTWTSKLLTPVGNRHNQFFPWLSVSGAGAIGVSWMDTRNDPHNVNYEEFATFSTNAGATFGKDFRLSGPSNPFNDGFSGFFIGDYTGNAWSGDTLYVTYTGTTTGVDQDFLSGYVEP